jgi:hypothetical protein
MRRVQRTRRREIARARKREPAPHSIQHGARHLAELCESIIQNGKMCGFTDILASWRPGVVVSTALFARDARQTRFLGSIRVGWRSGAFDIGVTQNAVIAMGHPLVVCERARSSAPEESIDRARARRIPSGERRGGQMRAWVGRFGAVRSPSKPAYRSPAKTIRRPWTGANFGRHPPHPRPVCRAEAMSTAWSRAGMMAARRSRTPLGLPGRLMMRVAPRICR